MKRSGPPKRVTPMRRTGMARKAATVPVKPRRSRSGSDPTQKTRDLVHARSGGRCEHSGCVRPAVHIHHRRPRRAGGSTAPDTNLAANLLDLCMEHHEDAESHRTVAHRDGLLLHADENPSAVPVLTRHSAVPVLLDNGGGWRGRSLVLGLCC